MLLFFRLGGLLNCQTSQKVSENPKNLYRAMYRVDIYDIHSGISVILSWTVVNSNRVHLNVAFCSEWRTFVQLSD